MPANSSDSACPCAAQFLEFPLRSAQLVGQVQAGQDGDAGGIGVGGFGGDGEHQIVHAGRHFLDLAGIAGGEQRIGPAQDGDPDGLFFRSAAFHPALPLETSALRRLRRR